MTSGLIRNKICQCVQNQASVVCMQRKQKISTQGTTFRRNTQSKYNIAGRCEILKYVFRANRFSVIDNPLNCSGINLRQNPFTAFPLWILEREIT